MTDTVNLNIYRRLRATKHRPFVFCLEQAMWLAGPIEVKWSRSTKDSHLWLDSGMHPRVQEPIHELGRYDRENKEYDVELPFDLVFAGDRPTLFHLETTGTANVLVKVPCVFPASYLAPKSMGEPISDAINNDVKVLGEDFTEIPMLPVTVD